MRFVDNCKALWKENKIVCIFILLFISGLVYWNVVEHNRVEEWKAWNATRPGFNLSRWQSTDMEYYRWLWWLNWSEIVPNVSFSNNTYTINMTYPTRKDSEPPHLCIFSSFCDTWS